VHINDRGQAQRAAALQTEVERSMKAYLASRALRLSADANFAIV
jgi:hypothetical protein